MAKIFTLIASLLLITSCGSKKTIYVASTLSDCENNSSQKCIQIKENKEDEWTVLNSDVKGFEHKNGFLQKIEVAVRKSKKTPANAAALDYTFVKLIFEQKEENKSAKEIGFSLLIDENHTKKWKINSMVGIDSLTKQPTLIFKDGQISGNAGCNNYNANFTINQNEITLGVANRTKMFCSNFKIEKIYFNCLSQVKKYKLLDDSLTFYDVNNTEIMHCSLLEE